MFIGLSSLAHHTTVNMARETYNLILNPNFSARVNFGPRKGIKPALRARATRRTSSPGNRVPSAKADIRQRESADVAGRQSSNRHQSPHMTGIEPRLTHKQVRFDLFTSRFVLIRSHPMNAIDGDRRFMPPTSQEAHADGDTNPIFMPSPRFAWPSLSPS